MPNRSFVKNHHQEKILFKKRAFFLIAATAIILCMIFFKLFSLQVIQHKDFSTESRKNLIGLIPLTPNRGLIYDRNGTILAKNIPSFTLALVPYKVKNIRKTITSLKRLIPISPRETELFERSLHQHRNFDPIPIKNNLTEEQADSFYVNRYQFPGVIIETELKRQYPFSNSLSPVLGYVGRINQRDLVQVDKKNYQATQYIGKVGIEKYYEKKLHGTVGYAIAEINAAGQIVRYLKRIPPVNGQNLTLSIDNRIEKLAYKLMQKNEGALVAIDPSNGEIIAMVSTPSYDPNLFVNGITTKDYQRLLNDPNHPLFNRDIRGLYSPGSTVKPFIAYYALANGILNSQDTIVDPGWFKLPHTKHVFHDWKHDGHGVVNVTKAIIVSCDTFFYNLASKLGIARLDEALAEFNFGESTHIDLGEELAGNLPKPISDPGHPTRWYTGNTIEIGIGQGALTTTPLALAVSTTILANKGLLIHPHLLVKSTQPSTKRVTTTPISKTTVFSTDQNAWSTVTDAMQKVISSPHGTAIHFGKHAGYSVAGKTGTVQMYAKTRFHHKTSKLVPKELRNNHLFITFAPVNHPAIVVAIVVEHGEDADGIARHIIDRYLQLHPTQSGMKS